MVPAGSVVLFNSRLLHGARRNEHSSRTRYSMHLVALSWMKLAIAKYSCDIIFIYILFFFGMFNMQLIF